MANIFVDPVIVTAPPDNTSRDGIVEWLTNLTVWLQEALTSPFEWLHFVQATNLLQESERFPDFNLLKKWQKQYRLDINIIQIARSVNDFFRNEEFDLKHNLDTLEYDFEVESGSITINPAQFTTRWLDAIHEDMHTLFAATCVSKCLHHELARELRIATLAFPHTAREIEVSAIIVDAIPDFPRSADSTIVQTFPLLFTPDDLLPLINVIELWDKGAKGFTYAIEQQFRKDWHETVSQPMQFILGRCFIESVNDAGLDTNEQMLRRIVKSAAAVIADQAKNIKGYKLHELRESEAANSPQRTRSRDNAKAWRLMLEKHGAGWRLHYWQIPAEEGSIIEFSNVVKESDDSICE